MTVRSQMVSQARWATDHEPEIHYAMTRPIPYGSFSTHHLPLTTDCSGFVTCLAFTAGADDPNGVKYNGQGYTGTLLQHLDHIPTPSALAGDFIVFGAYPGHHVIMLMENGDVNHGNPLCVSHGQEAGPVIVRLSVEQQYFGESGQALRSVPIKTIDHWVIRNGRNEVIGKTKHPALWAMKHPKLYRDNGIVEAKQVAE